MPHPLVPEYGHWPANKSRVLAAHRNPGLEVVLVTRGQLLWQVEGRVEPVPAGSVFYTFPWELHGSAREREPGCELYFVVLAPATRRGAAAAVGPTSRDRRSGVAFRLHQRFGLSSRAMTSLRTTLLAARRRSWPCTARLAALMPALLDELQRDDRSDDAIAGLTRVLLVELHRSVVSPPPARARPPATERVRRFVDRLADECHQPWTLATMAAACDLGRTRFATVLRELTGDSSRMALNRARVKRARRLLTTTDRPVTRIALDCGFASSQHFANVFRTYTGTSASAIRT